MDQNIEIAVRIKPCPTSSISAFCSWNSHSIQVTDKNFYSFDSVIDPNASQQAVFEKVGTRIISNVLQGYNGCIFAYGQTGSGKTYTMTGYEGNDGIIQRCLKTLWNCVKKSEFFEIKLGYFQIYNESIKDLLSEKQNLMIRENSKTGFYVENLTERIVQKYDDFESLINHGISVRTVKQTRMNQTSSRSHSVLQVNVDYKRKQENSLSVLKHSKITFIDLAGSQKQKQTQVEGQRLKQAANINKSLSTLSLVISKLSQQSQRKSTSGQVPIHVPFRNSVLTRILKNSLTGKSKIIIVCTVSLQEKFIDQTISTLRFAQTAKSIKIKVNKNEEEFDGTKERLFEEFRDFKKRFNQLNDEKQQLDKFNENLKRENAWLRDEVQRKQAEINELQVSMECMKVQSHQIFLQMKSQSQMGAIPYSSFSQHPRNTSHSQTQFYEANHNINPRRTSQRQFFNEQSSGPRPLNSQINTFSDNNQALQAHSLQPQYFSQLSFFNSHLSSEFNSPKKSFFTIQEEDSKQEKSGTSSNVKLCRKIEKLQSQLDKLKLENEFLRFDLELQEQDIKELTKRSVFMEIGQHQAEQANKLFAQLVKNKQFSFAQLKFLDLCLKNNQKNKVALQLAEQQKTNQKSRFNKTVTKIKNLLLNAKQKPETQFFQQENFNVQLQKQKSSQIFQSAEKAKTQQNQQVYYNKSGSDKQFSGDFVNIQIKNEFDKQKEKPIKYPHSFNKRKSVQIDGILDIKGSQTPMNYRQQPTQVPILVQSSQLFCQQKFQSTQQQIFMQDSRSLRSYTSNKFSNNQLQYLKKEYEKMSFEVKELRQEPQKNKILLLERDSILDQKQAQLDECIDKIKKLEQDLETQKHLLQIERTKSEYYKNDPNITKSQLIDKSRQLQSLKQYLESEQRQRQYEVHRLNLKIKQLQLGLANNKNQIQNLNNERTRQIQCYQVKIQSLSLEAQSLKAENKQLSIDYGALSGQNEMLNQRYVYLKSISGRQVETPKKIYSKRSSFYSISQHKQTSENQINNINQMSVSIVKPKQLSEKQYIQVIENKTFEYMYQAAYYFSKKCYSLEEMKKSFEQKIINLQQQMKSISEKYDSQNKKLDHQCLSAKKSALSYQQTFVELKKQILSLELRLFDQQKLIDRLESNQKHAKQYTQLLETKLKQKNQKELQAKQKAHNLSAQLRDHSLTPNYTEKNSRFNFGKKRWTNGSEDSLITSGDTPFCTQEKNTSQVFKSTQSQKMIELPRNQVDVDELSILQKEIQEFSNEGSKQDKLNRNESQLIGTQSRMSHTVTNLNLTQDDKIEEVNRNAPIDIESQNLDTSLANNKQNYNSKSITTKSLFQLKNSNNNIRNFDNNLFSKKSKQL